MKRIRRVTAAALRAPFLAFSASGVDGDYSIRRT